MGSRIELATQNFSNSNLRAGRDNIVKNEYHYGASSSDPLALLRQHTALGALYDAAERPDPPKCHPETRMAVLNRISLWAQDRSDSAKPILWLHGAAGAGKSAIAQSLIEQLLEKKFIVPHFFFWRTAFMRNQKIRLLPTLAFQLAKDYPATKPMIEEAVADGSIFKRSLASQMEALIVGPLRTLIVASDKPLVILVVDGLDECCVDIPPDLPPAEESRTGGTEKSEPGERKAKKWAAREESSEEGNVKGLGGFPGQSYEAQQREILEALAFACQRIPTLRILVSSRPEREIRACFDGELRVGGNFFRTSDHSVLLSLNDQEDIEADITLFLDCEFAQIRRQRQGMPNTWPSSEQITLLVEKASGQFVYPSTVVKYIRRRRQYPVNSLEEILALQPESGSRKEHPLAELDALYALVLRAVHHDSVNTVKMILGIMCFASSLFQSSLDKPALPDVFALVEKGLTVPYLSRFLCLTEGEVLEHLTDLHSVLSIPTKQDEKLRFFHATLSEYLLDHTRSGAFFVCQNEVYLRVASLLLRHIEIVLSSQPSPHTRLYKPYPRHAHNKLPFCLVAFLGECVPSKDLVDGLWRLLREHSGDHSLTVSFDTTETTNAIRNSKLKGSPSYPVLGDATGFCWRKILEYLQKCNIPGIEASESRRKAIGLHLAHLLHCLETDETDGYPSGTTSVKYKLRWRLYKRK